MATASHLNHPGTQTPPAIAASTVAVTNSFAFPCLVHPSGVYDHAHLCGRADVDLVRARMNVHHLPDLHWKPTTASGLRHGHPIELVVVHRWGVRYVDKAGEKKSYQGVIRYFMNRDHRASAHVVYPGSAVPGEATQMVRWQDYAWAEAAYNPASVEVESADAIWLGHDEEGFRQLARIVAGMLHFHGLPPVWSHRRGFCRHADLGSAGGGHTECPTTDLALWRHFVGRVQHEHERGGFRARWGR